MQAAVDIVSTSPHPTNKISATIAGIGHDGEPFALSKTNHWPKAIEDTIGRDPDIGSSSGTLHAETACILSAPKTKDASIFITDPPCPNCMKNMAEAGISALYIDHKGFDKDWVKRRGDSFENMSLRVAAKAGIDVHVIYRKEQRFEIISEHAPGYKPSIENPAQIKAVEENWETELKISLKQMDGEPFALAIARDEKGPQYSIRTDRHPTIGYTSENVEKKDGKYSFILQPVNRILMIAAREGLKIEHLYSSRTPTSREFVNLVGAGIKSLQIGDKSACRDEHGITALRQISEAKILDIS